MLQIKDLKCSIDNKEILKGINLTVNPGEIHIIMGPNGSGKSTLARTLIGFQDYQVTSGSITIDEKDIVNSTIDERARAGLFMAYQYPVEIPGVNFRNFLRLAYNTNKVKDEQLSVFKFKELLEKTAKNLSIPDKLLDRDLNYNLSGGEKKKMEILQMAILEPKYAILDETDSGLDVDAVKTIFAGINTYAENHQYTGFIIITHYERILEFITPDTVHILSHGMIVKQGGNSLIKAINQHGYAKEINTEN